MMDENSIASHLLPALLLIDTYSTELSEQYKMKNHYGKAVFVLVAFLALSRQVKEVRDISLFFTAQLRPYEEVLAFYIPTRQNDTSNSSSSSVNSNVTSSPSFMKLEKSNNSELSPGMHPLEPPQDGRNSSSNSKSITSNSTASPAFMKWKESKVTELSPGMYLFEHICINRPGGGPVRMHSYTKYGRPLQILPVATKMYTPDNEAFMTATIGNTLEQWPPNNGTFQLHQKNNEQEHPILWTLQQYVNPAHCMTDQLFPLALDKYYRGSNSTKNPFYDRYLLGKYWKFYDAYAEFFWCYDIMRAAGFLQASKPGNIVTPMTTFNWNCFESLAVPPISMYRYPINKQEDPEQFQAFTQIMDRNKWKIRYDLPDSARYHFPTKALTDMRDSITNYYNLSHDPWPQEQSEDAEDDSTTYKQIFIHARAKKQKRKITNVQELKKRLEEDYYHVNVTLYTEEWLPLTLQQQMQVYNSYRYIITGHGAHLANGTTNSFSFFGCPTIH
jgi:hypothetical protein